MRIDLAIFDNKQEPVKMHFTGVWALEEMIKRLVSKYYSEVIASKIIDYLRDRRV